MFKHPLTSLNRWGGYSFIAGIIMLVSFIWLIQFPGLRGDQTTSFLVAYSFAFVAYAAASLRLSRDHLPLHLIWVFALIFRFALLFTTPSLSDDVYRYIWDGHLFNLGVNPYAFPVESPSLDSYDIPLRELVNHSWMASPYLPSAQLLFASITRFVPQSPTAFQVTAAVFDLGTAWLVMSILKMLNLPRRRILIYLWNPLIVVEFSHAAHIDSLMLFLMMAAFWFLVRARPRIRGKGVLKTGSVFSLAAGTLTKALPVLLAPLFIRRWGWWRVALYIAIIISSVSLSTINAGWGLTGPLDGSGVFGALRIYNQHWNYNSSIYHWLEVLVSGHLTPGAVPVDLIGESTLQYIRTASSGFIVLVAFGTGIWAWFLDDAEKRTHEIRSLYIIRLACIPLGAYLLLTHTLHPWYLAIIIPLIPFLLPAENEGTCSSRFIFPWSYLSWAVAFSYLTYLNPNDFREYQFVRLLEYLPFYGLLIWAGVPCIRQGIKSIYKRGTQLTQ